MEWLCCCFSNKGDCNAEHGRYCCFVTCWCNAMQFDLTTRLCVVLPLLLLLLQVRDIVEPSVKPGDSTLQLLGTLTPLIR